MTLEELELKLKSAGNTTVVVTNDPPSESDHRLIVCGGLEEYQAALRSVNSNVVFVYAQALEVADFHSQVERAENDDDDADETGHESIDLCDVYHDLRQFRGRLDHHGLFYLSAPFQTKHLDLLLEEPWWTEFWAARSKAVDDLLAERAARMAALRAKDVEAVEAALLQLQSLAGDPKFAKLPTQKAMLQYALQRIPQLGDIDRDTLKVEIQELKAKIDAS